MPTVADDDALILGLIDRRVSEESIASILTVSRRRIREAVARRASAIIAADRAALKQPAAAPTASNPEPKSYVAPPDVTIDPSFTPAGIADEQERRRRHAERVARYREKKRAEGGPVVPAGQPGQVQPPRGWTTPARPRPLSGYGLTLARAFSAAGWADLTIAWLLDVPPAAITRALKTGELSP